MKIARLRCLAMSKILDTTVPNGYIMLLDPIHVCARLSWWVLGSDPEIGAACTTVNFFVITKFILLFLFKTINRFMSIIVQLKL